MTGRGPDTRRDSCVMGADLDESCLDAVEDNRGGAEFERCEETTKPSLALATELEKASPV